jgi:hypothetical protein
MMGNKVYVRRNLTGKYKWYKGVVVGRNRFLRRERILFDFDFKTTEWAEDKLLVKMSNGDKVTVWSSDTYKEETVSG